MAHGQFIVSTVNPNDTLGGGGCACDERKQGDCQPPFIVCFANSMLDERSPHVVVCAACVNRMHTMLDGEALESGERGTVTQPQQVTHSDQKESPVVESPDPRRDFDDTPDI